MTGVIKRGLLAGAAGTTLLNAATYLDMAIRGRGESDTPGRTVDALLQKAGRDLPGSGSQQRARRTALGALSGIASGLGIGVAASAVRAGGVRLPALLGAVATGAGAMVGTNLPMAAAGISDPRTWTAVDWVGDAIPHLAYGVGTHAVIVAQDSGAPAPRPSAVLLLRSLSLGIASGSRSSLGFSAPALIGPGRASPTQRAAGRPGRPRHWPSAVNWSVTSSPRPPAGSSRPGSPPASSRAVPVGSPWPGARAWNRRIPCWRASPGQRWGRPAGQPGDGGLGRAFLIGKVRWSRTRSP